MSERTLIAVDDLVLRSCQAWRRRWFLLACGDFAAGRFNCMTTAWGTVGALWDRPVAMVAVKPGRYTFEFLQSFPSFTLCLFPAAWKRTLLYLGTHSGRQGDKIAACGLTPIASSRVAAPGFAEAELILECETLYADDYRPEGFAHEATGDSFRSKTRHRLFFAEIKAVFGMPEYATSGPGAS